ncbi:hypothetical protein [Calothrix sp. NIES-2100]
MQGFHASSFKSLNLQERIGSLIRATGVPDLPDAFKSRPVLSY